MKSLYEQMRRNPYAYFLTRHSASHLAVHVMLLLDGETVLIRTSKFDEMLAQLSETPLRQIWILIVDMFTTSVG